MKTQLIALILTVVFTAGNSFLFNPKKEKKSPNTERKIQIALLLDTSGSMDGLIDQAKSQLWLIVNELSNASYENEQPILEIALYEYGNDGNSKEDGYIRKVTELTTDLDKISEELFALTTNGGDEYCGQAIDVATTELAWSDSRKDLKMIFIAGNEPFTQGDVSYEKACGIAGKKGIVVNTIFCGNFDEGINTKWKDGAKLTNGEYMNIEQNNQTVYIESPYDEEINRLNTELNQTYIAYGNEGEQMKTRQQVQDVNSEEAGGFANVATRAMSKSSKNYRNSHWDLIDASEDDEEFVNKLKKEELPEEMKNMNEQEKIEYVELKKQERSAIQDSIKTYGAKREIYVAEQKKQMADQNTENLNDVMINAIRKQAETNGYEFEK